MLASNNRRFQWINFIWFQLVWFSAVYFTEAAQYFLIISLFFHFYLTPSRRNDLWVMLAVTLLGAGADTLLKQAGVMGFIPPTLLPLWLLLLWAHFALSLNHSLNWLTRLPIYLQAIFGGIFGPLSYYAGSKMGAVLFPLPMATTLSALAVIWSCLLPVYLLATRYFRGNGYDKRYNN